MRYLLVPLLSLLFLFTSCAAEDDVSKLAYQESRLSVEAEFSIGGESVNASLTLEAPSYDENGRMLARDAVIIFCEDSILSGLGFEITNGYVFIISDDLRIPIERRDAVSGIFDIISLFCISESSYYSSERFSENGIECERAVYISGDNRIEVVLDLGCGLPTDITALIDGKELSADIKLIRAE